MLLDSHCVCAGIELLYSMRSVASNKEKHTTWDAEDGYLFHEYQNVICTE